jgi:hypothetical protein
VAPVAESRFLTRLDRKFFERSDVVHQHVEHAQLVAETDQEVEAGGMKRDALGFFVEVLKTGLRVQNKKEVLRVQNKKEVLRVRKK